MNEQATIQYKRIEEAIAYIQTHYAKQPSLEEIAAAVHLSPDHFQRIFSEWAGVSPKAFLQYISIQHAKKIIQTSAVNLLDVTHQIGLSSTSRLHDLFIKIEGMTPAEYKNEGAQLTIQYSFSQTFFGEVLVASTSKGICHLTFIENQERSFDSFKKQFPKALFEKVETKMHKQALAIFSTDWTNLSQIKLHLKGTDFQLNVWQALLKIPFGNLTTYGTIAKAIDKPSASRAVGTAIGSNPIAFLIPCHRVIQSSGQFGGYMWGPLRKTAMIGWEGGQKSTEY
ncbi:bifunctional helix-turn-helix domain-containing protein/methylated-DNA--[protein]-cysteine S-methyltransferase [uncultured Cytophaga sp.]|uniref:bifunctional helix-turn-helix domain-containing protein/methylated-DNA--[protein]-cysteine S-methyltransferase n=1 Tax=uncultured Cytophaga sp. TaxID=160238 RepID=UPI002607A838|nr:bifunctional helix-turn-helix domain-containing protein/methylated-DNA--[protein]-cysteine S-methyltransferase [uncultured Cytophaga sp.]